jgi:hypothetical protein
MTNIRIVSYRQRLDNLFDQVKEFTDNFELQAQWSRYLCILVAGFIEKSLQEILYKYAYDRASSNVVNYVYSRLKRFNNPNMENILKLLGSFQTEWRLKIEIISEGEMKDAVDSVMALRNPIAHGENTGISYTRIKEYYKSILKLIEHIEIICSQ